MFGNFDELWSTFIGVVMKKYFDTCRSINSCSMFEMYTYLHGCIPAAFYEMTLQYCCINLWALRQVSSSPVERSSGRCVGRQTWPYTPTRPDLIRHRIWSDQVGLYRRTAKFKLVSYTVNQKRPNILLVHNFAECWPILKILPPFDSAKNLRKKLLFVMHRMLAGIVTCNLYFFHSNPIFKSACFDVFWLVVKHAQELAINVQISLIGDFHLPDDEAPTLPQCPKGGPKTLFCQQNWTSIKNEVWNKVSCWSTPQSKACVARSLRYLYLLYILTILCI